MSKNYTEVSNQVACIQTSTRTLAFYANLIPVQKETFAELITGKIKVGINDFSKGKGDNAQYAYYNLELKDVKYLYTRAKYANLPAPFYGQKIHGAYPIQEGVDKGLCGAFHITINRTLTRKDGQIAKNPWSIGISNGVAIAQKGSIEGTYFEQKGSYQQRSYASINLSDIDFLDCMEKIYAYINAFRDLVSRNLIPQGYNALKEKRERGTYNPNIAPQDQNPALQGQSESVPPQQPQNNTQQPVQRNSSAQNTQVDDSIQPPVQQQAVQNASSAQDAQIDNGAQQPELHPTTLLIQSDFQALEGGKSIAQCMVSGKIFNIFFDQLSNELIEAQAKQLPITVNLYMDTDKRFRCYGFAG